MFRIFIAQFNWLVGINSHRNIGKFTLVSISLSCLHFKGLIDRERRLINAFYTDSTKLNAGFTLPLFSIVFHSIAYRLSTILVETDLNV